MITIDTNANTDNTQSNIELTSIAIIVTLTALIGVNCTFPINENIDFNVLPKQVITRIFNLTVVSHVLNRLRNIFGDAINIEDNGKFMILDTEIVIEKLYQLMDEYGWNYDMSAEDFISNIDNTAPLKYYPINDLKYAPLILMEHLRNKNFIKNITIAPEKWNYTDHHSYNYNFDDSFKIIVDVTTITNKIDNVKEKKSNKQSKFATQQQKMYDYITNKVKKYDIRKINKFQLEKDLIIRKKNLAEAVNRLNKQYRIIYNKDSSFKLLSTNRGYEYYDVNEEWYKQTINN